MAVKGLVIIHTLRHLSGANESDAEKEVDEGIRKAFRDLWGNFRVLFACEGH